METGRTTARTNLTAKMAKTANSESDADLYILSVRVVTAMTIRMADHVSPSIARRQQIKAKRFALNVLMWLATRDQFNSRMDQLSRILRRMATITVAAKATSLCLTRQNWLWLLLQ
jgi:hypothetical protein